MLDSSFLTICIPTYNRGERALALVEKILADEDFCEEVHVLVLNNASMLQRAAYSRIEDIAKTNDNLTYIAHEQNKQMCGNFLASFQLAETPYIMIISDEDEPSIAAVANSVPTLRASPNIAIFRPSIGIGADGVPRNAWQYSDQLLAAGQQALLGFALTNNYFSGTIYNRAYQKDVGVLAKLEANLDKYAAYPHLYLEILTCALCDVASTSEVFVIEGVPELSHENSPLVYAVPYAFGSRVDQFIAFRDAIREAVTLISPEFDTGLFITAYLSLCEKYLFLVTMVNVSLYANNNIHPIALAESLLPIFGGALCMYPEIAPIYQSIAPEIEKIHTRYLTQLKRVGD